MAEKKRFKQNRGEFNNRFANKEDEDENPEYAILRNKHREFERTMNRRNRNDEEHGSRRSFRNDDRNDRGGRRNFGNEDRNNRGPRKPFNREGGERRGGFGNKRRDFKKSRD